MNDELFRELAILDTDKDPKVRAFVTKVRDVQNSLDVEQQQLFSEGNLTPQGIGEHMAKRRAEEREKLEAETSIFATRSEHLAMRVKKTTIQPELTKLDPDLRHDLLSAWKGSQGDARRRLMATLESRPELCMAIASLEPSSCFAYGISELTHERATAIAYGGKRDSQTGRFTFPNQKEHERLRKARTDHTRALRILKAI